MTTYETAPLIPSFDDEAEAGRKLAIICSKGNLDMAYPGLIRPTPPSARASRRTCSSPSGAST